MSFMIRPIDELPADAPLMVQTLAIILSDAGLNYTFCSYFSYTALRISNVAFYHTIYICPVQASVVALVDRDPRFFPIETIGVYNNVNFEALVEFTSFIKTLTDI